MTVGVMMTGGNPASGAREVDDFYRTPAPAAHALLKFATFGPKVHECACGEGDLSKIIQEYGYDVVSTDLVDRGYGTGGVDFLNSTEALAPVIITNPPFNLAADFIEHAMGTLKVQTLALLLKSTFWHAESRRDLFNRHPLAIVGALPFRLDFKNLGRPTMECSWFMWERGHVGETSYHILPNVARSKRKKELQS